MASARIPLRARDGSIRAWTIVDLDDADFVNRWTWRLHAMGYAFRGERNGKGIYVAIWLHRELLGLTCGDGLEGDHINADRLDNRRQNLRVATRAENGQNVRSRGGTSRFRGVCFHRSNGLFYAHGRVNGKQTSLGYYGDEEEAAAAAAAFRAEHMPFSQEALAA